MEAQQVPLPTDAQRLLSVNMDIRSLINACCACKELKKTMKEELDKKVNELQNSLNTLLRELYEFRPSLLSKVYLSFGPTIPPCDPSHKSLAIFSKLTRCQNLKNIYIVIEILKHDDLLGTMETCVAYGINSTSFTETIKDPTLHNQIPVDIRTQLNENVLPKFVAFCKMFNEQLCPPCTSGGSTKKYVLGRNRKIIKKGRTSYVRYKNELITLKQARKLERQK